ncbi:Cytochrome P450 6j1 [Gryllus bimaculatus]|nr:Cytochrome P450 6j1 [Gryllus bimaculatus]
MISEWVQFNWLTICIAVIPLIYLYLTWNYNYWKKRNVAFVKPQLIFGNYKEVFLQKRTVSEVMEDIYKKLDGKPFVGFWRFRTPGILVRDPEMVKTVLMKDFHSFEDNAIIVDPKMDPLLAKNPFFVSGEKWKNMRSVLSPSFTSGKLKPLLPLMEGVCEELLEYLRATAPTSAPDGIEASLTAFKYTVEMVARCALGIKGNNFTDSEGHLRTMVRRIIAPGFWKNIEFMIMNFLPSMGSFLHLSWMPRDVDLFFTKIVTDVMDYRKKNNVIRPDYLQYLINMSKKENGVADALGHAVTFMTEGSETSSITLGFAWYELARHPDVQAAVRRETPGPVTLGVHAMGFVTLGPLTVDLVPPGPVCLGPVGRGRESDARVAETLRLHAPLMAMEKTCTRATELRGADGVACRVEPGTLVVIPVRALHHDPAFYPEPLRFDPGRWAPGSRERLVKYTYLPFGEGPRICLGMRFAQLQVKLALAYVVEKFDIKMTPKTPNPVVQDPTYFLTCAKGGLWLRFEERKSTDSE